MAVASTRILELIHVTRRFPGVIALDDVCFDLKPGEVHGLVGENGAGKTTLIHIVSGVLEPDSGHIRVGGQPVRFGDPVTARAHGVATVHQEVDLFESLSVAENMALWQGLPTTRSGRVRWGVVRSRARAAIAALGETIDVDQPAWRLSIAQRQVTQIAAALDQQAKIVVLDEPTSSLTAAEAERLFEHMARLTRAGVGIVYISHRQDEVLRLSDRITVFRDGRRVWTGDRADVDREQLIEAMVGRSDARAARRQTPRAPGPVRLRTRGLTSADGKARDVDLDVRAGEIVGVHGLIGAGRSELAQTIFGLGPRAQGHVEIDGRRVRIGRPADAVRAGIAYVPEDRLRQGLCRGLAVRDNMVLSSLDRCGRGPWTSLRTERSTTEAEVVRFNIRLRSIEQPIVELSGGNQQKVVLARWMLTEPKVLLLDEPARGVDVGAKVEIHRLVRDAASAGAAVLLISSELPEVLEQADRVVVLREGCVAGEFDPAKSTAAEIASAAIPAATPIAARARAARTVRRNIMRLPRSELGLLLAIGLLCAMLAVTTNRFATLENLSGVVTAASVWTILALAAAVVIIAGGIDISIGSLLALSAAVGGFVLKLPWPPAVTIPLALAAAVVVGTAGGLANAGIALAGRVHPIVVTLGTLTIYRGLLITLTGGTAIVDLPPAFGRLATARVLGINGATLMMLIAATAAYLVLAHTRAGRHMYAVGCGPSAARLAGIRRGRTWLLAFAAGGLLTGLAGIVELAKIGSMQSVLGTGYELRAIAAAVIGGVAISGGRGSVAGVVLGALLLSVLYNALVLWQVSPYHYDLVIGGLILVAVVLDLAWRKLER